MHRRKRWGLNVQIVPQMGSTNRCFMESEFLSPGQALIALEQTEGRGRLGRVWQPGPKGQLFASFWVAPGQWPFHPPTFTLFIGLAVFQALTELGLNGHQLKWPNDVLVGDKKLAGILCESKQKGLVVGIGLNLKGQANSFPQAVRDRVVSLESLGLDAPSPEVMLGMILDQAEQLLEQTPDLATLSEAWQSHCGSIGKWVSFEHLGLPQKGRIVGLSPHGALLVELNRQVIEVTSGEVTFTNPPPDC